VRCIYSFGVCSLRFESSGIGFWVGWATSTLQVGGLEWEKTKGIEPTCIQFGAVSLGGRCLSFSLLFLSYAHQLLIVGYVSESQFLPSVWLPPLAISVAC
jgi:hypothetical protein